MVDVGFQAHFVAPSPAERETCYCPDCINFRFDRAAQQDEEYDAWLSKIRAANDVYAQAVDKTHIYPTDADVDTPRQLKLEQVCPGWAMVGECEGPEGVVHILAKELIDGKEWCSYCGGVDGLMHDRRKARWYPKAQQIASMAYVNSTFPPELRGPCVVGLAENPKHLWCGARCPARLSMWGIAWKRMLQRHGFKRGLRSWDWFGECKDVGHQFDKLRTGKDCGCKRVYHPHVSALVDGGYIEPDRLDAIKASWAAILGVDVARVNLWYQYADDVPKKLHWVNYLTRPTFLRWQWDEEMAYALHKFRTYTTWGHWDDGPVWEVPQDAEKAPTGALVALEAGFCPHDGSAIRWSKDPCVNCRRRRRRKPRARLCNKCLPTIVGHTQLELWWTPIEGGYWENRGPPE